MSQRNESTQLLSIAEKLLTLAEDAAEIELQKTRATTKFRRENIEQLDRIEAKVERLKNAEPAAPDLADAVARGKKLAPWVVAVIMAIAHVVRSLPQIHF